MDEKEKIQIIKYLNRERLKNVKYSINDSVLSPDEMVTEIKEESDLGKKILDTLGEDMKENVWKMLKNAEQVSGNYNNEKFSKMSAKEYFNKLANIIKNPEEEVGFVLWRKGITYGTFLREVASEDRVLYAHYELSILKRVCILNLNN